VPPPDDSWATPGRGSGHRRGWLFAVGVVCALVLTGVVATIVVLATRTTVTATPPVVPAAPRATVTRPVTTPVSVRPATPSPSASPTPKPTAAATTAPTAAPQQPMPTASAPTSTAPDPDRILQHNRLYAVDLDKADVSCGLKVRRPKPALANAKLQPYLTDVVGCLTDVFTAPLAAQGFTLAEPKVKTYHKRVDTVCGDFGQSGSPAYYCSGTTTIYWPDTVDDGREAYTFARLGYVGLTAHEFGHHLQFTTGMLNAYSRLDEGTSKKEHDALSRRLELQAQCFEGVFLHATREDLDVSGKDAAELKAWHSYTGDEDPPKSRRPDHGSSRAQWAWLERGLDSGDFGSCNTWTASASSVR
jgi:predicted metalloprotease